MQQPAHSGRSAHSSPRARAKGQGQLDDVRLKMVYSGLVPTCSADT